MYQALFATAYFGLFQVGELTKGSHPICAKDVHIGENKKKLLFILHTSKTHWKNSKPQSVKISSTDIQKKQEKTHFTDRTTIANPCPYKLLRKFLNVRKKAYKTVDEPFFIFSDRTPVRPTNLRRVLKMMLQEAGLDFRLYNTMSFRAGRAECKCGNHTEIGKMEIICSIQILFVGTTELFKGLSNEQPHTYFNLTAIRIVVYCYR